MCNRRKIYRRPSQYWVARWEWYQYVPDWSGTVKLYLYRVFISNVPGRKVRKRTGRSRSGQWGIAWQMPVHPSLLYELGKDRASAITKYGLRDEKISRVVRGLSYNRGCTIHRRVCELIDDIDLQKNKFKKHIGVMWKNTYKKLVTNISGDQWPGKLTIRCHGTAEVIELVTKAWLGGYQMHTIY